MESAPSGELLFAEVDVCLEAGKPIQFEQEADGATTQESLAEFSQELDTSIVRGEETFFREKLGDVDEPTVPFGILDVCRGCSGVRKYRGDLEPELALSLRVTARRLGVSVATMFHAAWAVVVSRTSARDDVIYGAGLARLPRISGGAQRTPRNFINILPLRLRLRGVTTQELVEATQRELAQLLDHVQTPLAVVQSCSGMDQLVPLFTALLCFRSGVPNPDEQSDEVDGIPRFANQVLGNFPISMLVDDTGESFGLTVHTDRRLDPQRIVGYLSSAMCSLVETLERNLPVLALDLSIVPKWERRLLTEEFNATRRPFLRDKLIHELFEEQVERTPHAVAVEYEDQSLTFSELNARANQLGRNLRQRGIGPDQLVGIYVERCVEMVVGLLGILKAGGAYVPLDLSYPTERLLYTLEDASLRVLLTKARLIELLPSTQAEVIALDKQWGQIAQEPNDNLEARTLGLNSNNLAYVIYTSGSTGKPKGVMVEHAGLVNYLQWASTIYEPGRGEAIPVSSTLAFDATVTSLYSPLFCGRPMVLIPSGRELEGLEHLLQRSTKWSLIKISPAHLQLLGQRLQLAKSACTVNAFIIGGEALPPSTVQLWRSIWPQTRLINEYGPTEAVVGCCVYEIPQEWKLASHVPIGRPIANAQIYILDSSLQPVPIGVVGELYIGGAGVTRGYLNRPGLTAERFIADPFGTEVGARLYKTGDLGRWGTDGTIEYLGRNDHQVKIRGFRIELGEIEAQLRLQVGVKEALVLVREDVIGDKRLVAYVVPSSPDSDAAVRAEVLRPALKKLMQEHMVPSAFVVLESLPLTSNGKLDRRALPVPELGAYVSREYEAPQGKIEEILAGIWQELLQVSRVGRRDNFFELGGHSLLIVQMMERLRRRLGLSVQVREVFESATLADLAGALVDRAVGQVDVPPNLIPYGNAVIEPQMLPLVKLETEHIERIVQTIPGGAQNVQDIYPLAPLQEGLLFHHLLEEGGGDVYLIPTLLSVSSRERLEQLIAALQRVISRHDVLRTAVLWERLPRPVQVVYREVKLPVEEVVLDRNRDSREQVEEWLRPERRRLDLRRAPLLRLRIAADPHGEHWYALLQFHHLIGDNTSQENVVSEVVSLLERQSQNFPDSISYRIHVAQALAYAATHDSESFFRDKLKDIDEPTAPFGLLDVRGDGSRIQEAHEDLDATLSQHIRTQARRLGMSPATLFHAAWALVVAHTSGHDDLVFGCVLLGRLQGSAGAQRILGMFINTLPLRLRLRGLSAGELMRQTQRELVDLLSHEQASLAVAQRCSGLRESVPLFTSLLNYRHRISTVETAWEGAAGIKTLVGQDRTNYPVVLSVDDDGDGFALTAQTDQRVHPQRVIKYLRTALQSLVHSLQESSPSLALNLPIIPEDERRQIVESFNATRSEYSQERLIHELFEEQTLRAPDAVAVECGVYSFTYAKLNSRANALARSLKAKGVSADDRVAICMNRNPEMIVALLGALKAGGAYVPLDPKYPIERLQYMLRDSSPKVFITEKGSSLQTPVTTIVLGRSNSTLAEDASHLEGDARTEIQLRDARRLAYVIYTSGSTGLPKGVMIEHRSLHNLVDWHIRTFDLKSGCRSPSMAGIGFDATTWEIWPPLCSGATLVLPSEASSSDAAELLRWWKRQDLTVSFLVTPLAELAYAIGLVNPGVNSLLVGGDRLRRLPDSIPPGQRLVNNYGPTEATVVATSGEVRPGDEVLHIGRPIANTQIYILGSGMQPVPKGLVGELYIGGAGIARGYFERPELTAERFVANPFKSDPGARLYRSGDLARWLPDGTIDYLGRTDHQVKIRGFRIELQEIESRLCEVKKVQKAIVVARQNSSGETCLIAYVIPDSASDDEQALSAESLRVHLKSALPDFMIPNKIVLVKSLPLTANGKIDREALPSQTLDAGNAQYEPPEGEVENLLASVWKSVLHVEQVGRGDNFFRLGGHSLLVVQMMERVRRLGLSIDVRKVFETQTLAELAKYLCSGTTEPVAVPPNRIPRACEKVTPQMLTLVRLTEEELDVITQSVPGGAANIEDIYPLTPLQEGMLFHHLLNHGKRDIYIVTNVLSLPSKDRLEELIAAIQVAIDKYDVLRTAMIWEGVSQPLQVVLRHAVLPIEVIKLDKQLISNEQMRTRLSERLRTIDLRQAPLMRLEMAPSPSGSEWYAILHMHHLTCDHVTLETLAAEIVASLEGRKLSPVDPTPFRDHVFRTLTYGRTAETKRYFCEKLGDIDEPTAPFGWLDVDNDEQDVDEARLPLAPDLSQRIHSEARLLGVTPATLFHVAWGLVVAHTSARTDVVFGSVLSGRIRGDAMGGRALGMLINTLPLRLKLENLTALGAVEKTQEELIGLLIHEHASLSDAQRCTQLSGQTPLFGSLLNYRHTDLALHSSWSGAGDIRILEDRDRTNYPITVSIDDFGGEFCLTVQTGCGRRAERIAGYLHTAVHSLLTALESNSQAQALSLSILPDSERCRLLPLSAGTPGIPVSGPSIHSGFEAQVSRRPDSVAVSFDGMSLSYAQLNERANRLARYLMEKGVRPDRLVGLCTSRSLEMLVGILGILKAGGAYLPLDPNYPADRLRYVLSDAKPWVLLTMSHLRAHLPRSDAEVICLDENWQDIDQYSAENLESETVGLTAANLAYVIYTSGSTGNPKGVMIEHRNVTRLFETADSLFSFSNQDVWTLFHSYAFDFSVWELWGALLYGGKVILVPFLVARSPADFLRLLLDCQVTVLNQTPSAFLQLANAQQTDSLPDHALRFVIFGGEALEPHTLRAWTRRSPRTQTELVNMYGITETTVHVTHHNISQHDIDVGTHSPIGQPLGDLQIHLLGIQLQPVPLDVVGEIHVGGAGVARGYLNRPALTAERFIADPFSDVPEGRLYKSGDLARRWSDGTIEYLGRNDHQLKIRGFRVELGEIEAQLLRDPDITEAVVTLREDAPGDRRLVAYFVARDPTSWSSQKIEEIRIRLKEVLPDYMVPSGYVMLERMPLTDNGKLDRKSLPKPGVVRKGKNGHEVPQGRIEVRMALLWQEVFDLDEVGRNDNFFDLGGHSLLALKLTTEIRRVFDASLSVVDIYQHPKLHELSARLSGRVNADELVELSREAVFPDEIVPTSGSPRHPEEAILLTGATGFVGRFLLAQLLRDRSARIYCLVRAQSQQQAQLRLRTNLTRWDLWTDGMESRVIAIPGDLSMDALGLRPNTYARLCAEVDSVIHCGTSMNHLETYEMAKAANVGSAIELLRFATRARPKTVNYISTLSVFGSMPGHGPRVVDELSSIEDERHFRSEGYAASKWVSERIFGLAQERGIPCNIFRLGLVWADTEKGRYDELQREYRILKTCLISGLGIRGYRYQSVPTPVDYVARAVSFLSERYARGGGVFHICSSDQDIDGVFEQCNELMGISLELKTPYEWVSRVKQLHEAGQLLPAVPLLEYTFSMDERSFFLPWLSGVSDSAQESCDRTHRELEAAGIIAPRFNGMLLRKCLGDMMSRSVGVTRRVSGVDSEDTNQEIEDAPRWESQIRGAHL